MLEHSHTFKFKFSETIKKKQIVVLSIRLDEDTLKAVDLLVDSGLEKNRSKAVSHFLTKGIQSSEDLLAKARILSDNLRALKNESLASHFGNEETVRLAFRITKSSEFVK